MKPWLGVDGVYHFAALRATVDLLHQNLHLLLSEHSCAGLVVPLHHLLRSLDAMYTCFNWAFHVQQEPCRDLVVHPDPHQAHHRKSKRSRQRARILSCGPDLNLSYTQLA
jgi:hypothetical protein